MMTPGKLFVLYLLTSLHFAFAQNPILPVKRDDFISRKGWWEYHRDGTAFGDVNAIQSGKGYLMLRLVDPIEAQECNVGISEQQNIYGKQIKRLVVEARLKVLSEMQPGSRGWGFWKSAKSGVATSLAWFMEQFAGGQRGLSWKLIGVVDKKQRLVQNLDIDFAQWHVYRIERDLVARSTSFFVDDRLLFSTPGIAPHEKLSFHLWIDNQVYSQTNGIQRKSWRGQSALVADFVQITTEPVQRKPNPAGGSVVLHEVVDRFGKGGNDQSLANFRFHSPGGKTLILATARAESCEQWDEPDQLSLELDRQPEEMIWDGRTLQGASRCLLLEKELTTGAHEIDFRSSITPLLSHVTVIGMEQTDLLINEELNSAPAEDKGNYLWKEYIFQTSGGEVIIYLSGSADEPVGWNHSRSVLTANDPNDDELILLMDGNPFPIDQSSVLRGDELFGDNGVLLLQKDLPAGSHKLQLLVNHQPTIYRLLVFGRK